jgi:putative transposase
LNATTPICQLASIVLAGLRGEDSIAELCRREGISQGVYYKWSKDFMEAGKRRLAGDTARAALRLRVRDICRQVCRENEVDILRGVLSIDHVHMFVSVPPKLAISDLVRKMKGRSSFKVQREFPAIRQRYWGQRFWGRGYFSTTNGAITEDVVLVWLPPVMQEVSDPVSV